MSLFRRGPSRSEIESALENVRGLVEILKLGADLSAAESLLREAEGLLSKNDLVHASSMIETAERVANAIEGDSRAASEATDALRILTDRMRALGIPVAAEEKSLAAIAERTAGTREAEGVAIPDYAGARAAAEESTKRAEARLALAERATDAIFAAELSVDGTSDAFPNGPVEALSEARQLLDRARSELARGNVELAATDAEVAEKIALGVADQRRQALGTLASVEKLLSGLRGLGIPVAAVTKSLEMGKTLLNKGKLVAAIDVFNEAAQEAVQLGTQYRALIDSMANAAKVVETLRAENLPTGEAESALSRAKTAMKAGNYALATALAEDVHLAEQRQRDMRENLRKQIEETKSQVSRLRELGLAFVNDAEEMVGRAEVEFGQGDYAATNEDLRIATLLMRPALNGKVKGSEIAP
ncbi:MAG TPA: hypothetical protein VGR51_11125 [Thermoplasmata archaeon]|nr:hypothetical protein [Thermoplasmata archaeon]